MDEHIQELESELEELMDKNLSLQDSKDENITLH